MNDKELYIEYLRDDMKDILKNYYEKGTSIVHTLDELEKLGLLKRNDVEGEILGNNTYSDEMIDYIVDRTDLEPLTEEIFIHN